MKYLIIVSLILAVLTIGAASASDDLASDDLAVSDDTGEEISQVDEKEVIAGEDASYYVNYQENVRAGPVHYSYNEPSIGVEFYNEDVSGNVTISVDNELKYNQEAIYYYDNYESNNIAISDLSLDYGIHNVSVKYLGNERYNPFEQNFTFNYYYMNVNMPDEISINGRGFYIDFARDTEGTLQILIDDELMYEESSIHEALYDEDEGDYWPYIYVYASDLTGVNDLSFAQHNYTIIYNGENYPNKEIKGSFNLTYKFEVYNEALSEDFSYPIYYAEGIRFEISVPSDATNDIILIANGEVYNIKVEGSNFYYSFNNLRCGENNLTFTYEDEKYYKQTVNYIFNAISEIEIPRAFDFNGDQAITLILPSNATGNLTVYKIEGYDENAEYILSVIKTSKLSEGVGNISLSDLAWGNYRILAKYTGDDYSVNDAENFVSVRPKVTYKFLMYIEDENTITIEAPENLKGNFTISIISSSYYDEESGTWIESIETLLYNGSAKSMSLTLPKLNVTEYTLDIKYIEDDEEILDEYYSFYARDDNPVWQMNATFPSEVNKFRDNWYWWDINNVPYNVNGYANLYIDDKLFDTVSHDDEYGFEGENVFDASNFTFGTHTWKLEFIDNLDYYKTTSQSGTFEVTWISVPQEVINGEDAICLDIEDDENAAGYLTLEIDGKEYETVFVNNGYARIELDGLSSGEHTYTVTYYGDKKYGELTRSGKFNVVDIFFFTNLYDDEDNIIPLTDTYSFETKLADDATGNVTFTVNGTSYTAKVVEGIAEVKISGLGLGNYSIVAKYSGDSKYPAKEISNKFTIEGYAISDEYDKNTEELLFIKLVLPADAEGNLTVYTVYYDDWDEEYYDKDLLGNVPVENGVAVINATDFKSQLKYGLYHIRAKYTGEDYSVESLVTSVEYSPNVNITRELFIGEDGKISVDLGNATGNITIYLNNEEFGTFELKDGKISEIIPASNLTVTENVITLKYVGEDDLGEHVFEDYNYDTDSYMTAEYYIYVLIKNITAPTTIDDGKGNITLELPESYAGNVTVYVNDEKISTTPVKGGNISIPVSNLKYGENEIAVEINGDDGSKYTGYVYPEITKPETQMDINVSSDSNSPEFVINLPSDATGSLIVTVDGKSYTADLVNGSAKISVPGLSDGTHEVTVKYSGDDNYAGFTKTTNVTVSNSVDPKITASNLNVLYTAGTKYAVTIYGTDGKVAANTEVTFLINGKVFKTVKTDAKGIASVAITQKPGTYKITTKALGKEVTKTLKVKHIVKLQKVKVKRSAKKLVIKVTLSKVNKKYIKGKKVTLKFKGKKYTAKTNKKGVAKFTIKKNVLKKLKKGKKVTYQATYLKDTVKRTVKVKK